MAITIVKIPFNIELAKQIESGEKEGKIITRDEKDVKIVCWGKKNETYPISASIQNENNIEHTYTFMDDGSYYDNETLSSKDLFLKIPIHTQFKDGDVIVFGQNIKYPLIGIFKEGYKHSHACYVVYGNNLNFDDNQWIYDNSRFATEEEKQKLIDALIQSIDPRAKNCLKKLGIEKNPKYKLNPFDKVLVRKNSEKFWKARFFDYEFQSNYFCTDGEYYENCIPYNAQTSYLHNTKKDYQNS